MIDELLNRDDPDQIIQPVGYDFGFSRRSFMQVLGAGLLISTASGAVLAQERPGAGRRGGRGGEGGFAGEQQPSSLDARLHIGTDGVITVMTGKVECGQGARAQITQAAAEELGVPAEQVRLIMADTSLTPDDGMTAGSRTTPATLPAVRRGCAAAKQLLEEFVKTQPAGHPITYADLAKSEHAAELLKKPLPRDVQLKPVGEWKILGTDAVPRTNGKEIVTGAHQYPADVIRPGMQYGKVLRQPSYGAKLTEIDMEPAKKIDGVTVVRDGDFVGVVATNTYTAKRAIAELEKTAKWTSPPHPSSATLGTYLREHTRTGGLPKNPFADQVKSSAKSLKASYDVAYVQHAPMEPRAAVAEWAADGSLTVWTATQAPHRVRGELATAFHIDSGKVRVIVPDFGGGFGGKHTGECAVEAARLAKAAGKPVALRWTRAEELTWAYFRPAAAIEAEASLGDDGKLATWHFVNVNAGRPGIECPYRVAKKDVQSVDVDAPPLRPGSYRALASTGNNFARECFIDELAALAGADPLAFRMEQLEEPRLKDVLRVAAEKFGWNFDKAKTPEGRGVGLACGTEKGSYLAACVEVQVDRASGAVKVLRVVQAFECGKITSPANLLSQNKGAIIMGLGPAFREAMEFEAGRIQNASFWKYEVPRMKDVPVIEVHLVDRPDLPSTGAGETPLIAVAPAIANAVFQATGQRVRQMPMKPLAKA